MKRTSRETKRSAGRPSAEMSEQVDSAVLVAAAAVFQEKGFAAASMKAIAERAGATRQTLYARFANKTALYKALMEARTSELLSRLSFVLDENEAPKKVLERFGGHLLSTFVSSDLQRVHRMVITDARTFPHLAAAFFRLGPERGKQLLQSYLQAQVRKGRLTIPDVEFAAEQFVGAIVGAVVMRSTLSQPQLLVDIDKQQAWVEAAVKVFLSAYGGPE